MSTEVNAGQPLVSIVLPTYNGARYLAESLDSCLAQTYGNWELIVVDDCSRDATPDIAAAYAARDGRIRLIRHETNRKLPGGLNTGHAAARGAFLTWTSDDNRYKPRAIERMVAFLRARPDVGLVYTDVDYIDDAGRFTRVVPAAEPSMLACSNIIGACFLYRREVYERVGTYDPELFLAEDFDYWLRVYRRFDIAPLPESLYEYRIHGASLSQTKSAQVHASMERTLRRHLPGLLRSSRPERARGWILCTATAIRRRSIRDAAHAYLNAVATAPLFALGYVGRSLFRSRRMARFSFELRP
jgi:glycosyltransferase involved in cell wall biosynthesis